MMAIQKQLDILQQGVTIWNTWREQIQPISIDLSGVDLRGADLYEANLRKADLRGANLSRADLSRVTLIDATLVEADLSWANLTDAILNRAILNRAILSRANLSRANLNGADLNGADLNGADLNGADLSRTNLSRTNLTEADLTEADLSRANLSRANLSRANLSRANLSRANLTEADLTEADLTEADLYNTRAFQTRFANLDLRAVKSMETILHHGPSHISTDTLERSNGDIPEPFLKGAGLSDTFIAYIRSLLQSPIQYYTCFISYSSQDQEFAERLYADLQQKGIRCWLAPKDTDIGDKVKNRIDETIRLYGKLLLILSEHSIKSGWAAYQIEKALNKEPQGVQNILYPVRIDQTILTCSETWAQEIKSTRHIGNFEHWTDHQQYQESFKRLLQALNTKKDQQKS